MASTKSARSDQRPRRRAAGVVLVGLLASCQATDKPAFVARAEESLETHRRRINRRLTERTERLGSLSAALTGCSLERRTAYELDPEQEDALGSAVLSRQLASLGVEPLPPTDPVARYVDQVGQYLALVAESVGNANGPDRAKRPERLLDNRSWPLVGYRFVVVPSEEPRAVGNPGGKVMISTGFLRSLESEEELAAVLAHEVAHVQRGHGVEVLKAFMCHHKLSVSSPGSRSLEIEAQQAANLYRDGFPEDFELEADRISIRILLAAGYDGRAFTGLLRRMAQEAPAKHAWLRMHPAVPERLETIGERLKALGPAQSWPSAEAIAPRTKRFLEAILPLEVASGAQTPP
ncbi:M48 family metallopeptidase [Hyalangium versicolor]|uniref:M48 family metallopeptidase n=1 Tax=Hyalangium versicolor TaxID=2861190 RepID=UPI001CCF10BF|nr:M48 family metallopeptidase [Hyalangium versicolor]